MGLENLVLLKLIQQLREA